ncbi:MAG: type IV pilus assembly protein PilM [Thermodesulfovibrionia bacterium]
MIFKAKGIIGLDIGSRNIKAVQLKEVGGGYQLERLGITSLQPELIVEGSILDATRVATAIKELIGSANIKSKDVTIGVSGHSSVITKRIPLPQMTEAELSESIKFEAAHYIPFDIEDVHLDFQIMGFREADNQMDVLIVAVKKDKVNEYVSVVREAGLNPVIVDVDAFALENMYELNYEIRPNENIALVNVGASMINLNVLKGGSSVFTRDSSVGCNIITEALQKEFALSYPDAERLKQGEAIEGISPEDGASVMASASTEIVSEISRSLDYFRSSAGREEIREIVLSGGGALIKDFPALLSERVGVDVRIVDPFTNIQVPDDFDKGYLKKVGPIVAVAVGLAIRRIGDR